MWHLNTNIILVAVGNFAMIKKITDTHIKKMLVEP